MEPVRAVIAGLHSVRFITFISIDHPTTATGGRSCTESIMLHPSPLPQLRHFALVATVLLGQILASPVSAAEPTPAALDQARAVLVASQWQAGMEARAVSLAHQVWGQLSPGPGAMPAAEGAALSAAIRTKMAEPTFLTAAATARAEVLSKADLAAWREFLATPAGQRTTAGGMTIAAVMAEAGERQGREVLGPAIGRRFAAAAQGKPMPAGRKPAAPAPLAGVDAATQAEVETLAETQQMDRILTLAWNEGLKQMDAALEQAVPAAQRALAKQIAASVRDEIPALIADQRQEYLKLLATTFTSADRQALIAFHRTPAGQRITQAMPGLVVADMALANRLIAAVVQAKRTEEDKPASGAGF